MQNKEYFKLVYREINKDFGERQYDLLDIGCATGDFLYYAKHNLKGDANLYGMDIMKSLIDRIDFDIKEKYVGNIEKNEKLPAKSLML